MAWFAALAPYLTAGAAVAGAVRTNQGGIENAQVIRGQAAEAAKQGYADEATQRRQSMLFLGKEAASAAEAGGGYGGTTAGLLKDSHANAEMDALAIRYKSLMRSTGLLAEASGTQREAGQLATGQIIGAGSQLAAALSKPKNPPPIG